MTRFQVRKVAVLGAGVMGAQIAAHLVNCKVPVLLFDLPAKEGPKNGIVLKAIDNLKKLKPAPLGVAEDAALITAANYDEHLALLGECDLVIEAIAERMDWKLELYTQDRAACARPRDLLASNTSGLSITTLSAALPEAHQAALLRHPLLQPAALHGAGRVDRHTDDRTAGARRTRSVRRPPSWARAWCGPRTRRTSSPTVSASPACWRRSRRPRTSV